jgi:hypothetical protein
MAKQINGNPMGNRSLTIESFAFSETGASGMVTSVGASGLEVGQSVFLSSGNGSFVADTEYFVIPTDSGSFQIAETKSDALNGVYFDASGDVGSGTVYPTFQVGGIIYVGTTGHLNCRGIVSKEFSLHKNISNGSLLPFFIKDINSKDTTASDLVAWDN